jgi:hypothetical protein
MFPGNIHQRYVVGKYIIDIRTQTAHLNFQHQASNIQTSLNYVYYLKCIS